MDIENVKKKLGLRLKGLRSSKGLKQEDLERFGFSYRYYGRIERGLANITLDTLVRLCDIFEISLADMFMFLESDQEASEDRETVVVKVAGVLNGKNKKKINKLKIFLDEIL